MFVGGFWSWWLWNEHGNVVKPIRNHLKNHRKSYTNHPQMVGSPLDCPQCRKNDGKVTYEFWFVGFDKTKKISWTCILLFFGVSGFGWCHCGWWCVHLYPHKNRLSTWKFQIRLRCLKCLQFSEIPGHVQWKSPWTVLARYSFRWCSVRLKLLHIICSTYKPQEWMVSDPRDCQFFEVHWFMLGMFGQTQLIYYCYYCVNIPMFTGLYPFFAE